MVEVVEVGFAGGLCRRHCSTGVLEGSGLGFKMRDEILSLSGKGGVCS